MVTTPTFISGMDYLLKVNTGTIAVPTYVTLGGLKASNFSIKTNGVEVTNVGSANWRELLDTAGHKSANISGNGEFINDTAWQFIRTNFLAQILTGFEIINGATGGTWAGLFKITTLDTAGDMASAVKFTIALESSGPMVFTPPV